MLCPELSHRERGRNRSGSPANRRCGVLPALYGEPHPWQSSHMSTAEIIAISVLAPLLLIILPITLVVIRRRRIVREELDQLLATEPALRGPENALYRSGTGTVPEGEGQRRRSCSRAGGCCSGS